MTSQINVNHTNLPDIGDTVITMSDYGSFNHGNSGLISFGIFLMIWFFGNDVGIYRSSHHTIPIKFSE